MILAQESAPLFDWAWVSRNWDQIVDRTWEHITLTVVSVAIGMVLALALSIVALSWRRTYAPMTWITGLLYTIPSLALFALLIPIVGLNATNAVIALTSYTLLILIRNTVAGVDGVPASVVEAADGMGYTRRARFWKMEVPLALPAIVAGLRIATVTTVGLVTVTAVLGLGGYGYFILRGLNTFFWTQIIVGVTLSVALATVFDLGFIWAQRRLTPWSRRAG